MSMKEHDYPLCEEYADKYNLVRSGGSDFHMKKLTSMGNHGLTKEQFERLLKDTGKSL